MLVVSVSFPFRSSRLLTRHSDRLFETAHTLCFWIYLYRVMVLNYGDLSILTKRDWSLSLSIVFHGIISALVQVSLLTGHSSDLILPKGVLRLQNLGTLAVALHQLHIMGRLHS